jgi:hypothetical protein
METEEDEDPTSRRNQGLCAYGDRQDRVFGESSRLRDRMGRGALSNGISQVSFMSVTLADRFSLSVDANWLKDPATEKQYDLYLSLQGYGELGRPEDMKFEGKVVSIRDLSKGQMSALM